MLNLFPFLLPAVVSVQSELEIFINLQSSNLTWNNVAQIILQIEKPDQWPHKVKCEQLIWSEEFNSLNFSTWTATVSTYPQVISGHIYWCICGYIIYGPLLFQIANISSLRHGGLRYPDISAAVVFKSMWLRWQNITRRHSITLGTVGTTFGWRTVCSTSSEEET